MLSASEENKPAAKPAAGSAECWAGEINIGIVGTHTRHLKTRAGAWKQNEERPELGPNPEGVKS